MYLIIHIWNVKGKLGIKLYDFILNFTELMSLLLGTYYIKNMLLLKELRRQINIVLILNRFPVVFRTN